jgi:chromosome segregation ATPase
MTIHGQAMLVSRRLDSQLKRERVAATVDALAATGQELSIAAIARHADVSRKFIYAHPDLRAQIEQRARQATAPTSATATANGHVTVASLRADLANAKTRNHCLRQQLRALEQRLSEALGRDIADELEPRAERPEELRSQLRDAQVQIFELQEQLADAREELDAVREINRELLADRNGPAQ